MKKLIILSVSLFSINLLAETPIFENCEKLPSPQFYKNMNNGKHMLAVDSCMKAFFELAGLVSTPTAPAEWEFSNAVPLRGGFPNNAFYHSESLKMIFETPSENNVYHSIIEGLDFRHGTPKNTATYSKFQGNLIPRLQICCEQDTRILKACSQITHRSYENENLDSCK